MTNNSDPLARAFEEIADALDNSPLVCFIPDSPNVIYGPMTTAEAFEFCATWNEFFAARGLPGRWEARNLLTAKP